MKLRKYQEKTIEIIKNKKNGNYLVQMATGLGKTVTFSRIPFKKRMLIISHRQELVFQPQKYFSCSYGIEQGKYTSNGEKVVSACIQSLHKRLDKFNRDDFDYIIIDEAHHAASNTYRKVINYFSPEKLLGFTATPNRGDGIKLDDIFEEIIFERDLKWGILNKFLCNIECKRVNISYSLDNIKTSNGDYQATSLDKAVNINKSNDAVAEAFKKHAVGQTIIFCTSVAHCHEIHKRIDNSKVIDGKTNSNTRQKIIDDFTNKKFKCLINCMVFTEGTDIPVIETVIIARPTKNSALYQQMVGRGLRLCENKEKLLLIDCVGCTNNEICTAPDLLGISLSQLAKEDKDLIEGNLFDLENMIIAKEDKVYSWINNIKNMEIFKKINGYDLHNVNYIKVQDGSFVLKLPSVKLTIPPPNKLKYCKLADGKLYKLQTCFDIIYNYLIENHQSDNKLWNTQLIKRWGKKKPTFKQLELIHAKQKNFPNLFTSVNVENLTRMDASSILNRLFS